MYKIKIGVLSEMPWPVNKLVMFRFVASFLLLCLASGIVNESFNASEMSRNKAEVSLGAPSCDDALPSHGSSSSPSIPHPAHCGTNCHLLHCAALVSNSDASLKILPSFDVQFSDYRFAPAGRTLGSLFKPPRA